MIIAKNAEARFGKTSVTVVSGAGWKIDARPAGRPGEAQLVYLSAYGAAAGQVIGAIGGMIALDVVADPRTAEVSVTQAGRRVLELTNVSAGGLNVAPGWALFRGGDPFCRSLLARMPAGNDG